MYRVAATVIVFFFVFPRVGFSSADENGATFGGRPDRAQPILRVAWCGGARPPEALADALSRGSGAGTSGAGQRLQEALLGPY